MCAFSHGLVFLVVSISVVQMLKARSTHLDKDQQHCDNHVLPLHSPVHPSDHHLHHLSSSLLRKIAERALSPKNSHPGSKLGALEEHFKLWKYSAMTRTLLERSTERNVESFSSFQLQILLPYLKKKWRRDLKHGIGAQSNSSKIVLRRKRNTKHASKRKRRHLKHPGILLHKKVISECFGFSCWSRHVLAKRRATDRTHHVHKSHSEKPASSAEELSDSEAAKTKIPKSADTTQEQPRTKRARQPPHSHRQSVDPVSKSPVAHISSSLGTQTSAQRSSSAAGSDVFHGIDGTRLNITMLVKFFKDQARERLIARQAQWAYLILVLLVCLMLGAMWCLGLRCRYHPNKHTDFHHNQYFDSMKEILWRKRHYLPMAQEPDWEVVQVCDCGTNP